MTQTRSIGPISLKLKPSVQKEHSHQNGSVCWIKVISSAFPTAFAWGCRSFYGVWGNFAAPAATRFANSKKRISPLRRRPPLPMAAKEAKRHSGRGVFRLPPPPESPHPTATNQGDLGPYPSVSLRSTSPPDRGSHPPIGCTPRGLAKPSHSSSSLSSASRARLDISAFLFRLPFTR